MVRICAACFYTAMLLACAIHAADAPLTKAERAELEATVFPYEPWVKTARVGDYIVRKFSNGSTVRCEVRSLDDTVVTLDETTETKSGKTELRKRYSRVESAVKTHEIEMKSDGVQKQRINGTVLKCEAFDGLVVTARKEWNGELLGMKVAHYHKVVAEGVPFGGIIRELQAPDDKIPLVTKEGSYVRLVNTIELLQVVMEVTAWGNSVDEKKR